MCQRSVEQVIGRLVTDEGFRRRFAADPRALIQELVEGGLELNSCELRALTALNPHRVARFADAVDPRIQKVELRAADVEIDPVRSSIHRSEGGNVELNVEPEGDKP